MKFFVLFALLFPLFASGESRWKTIRVVDQFTTPVENAVIQFLSRNGKRLKVSPKDSEILQKGEWFSPFLKVIPMGSRVKFKNLDPIGHIVRSNPKNKTQFFEQLSINSESNEITFKRPGFVDYFCEIHSFMRGIVYVTETKLFGKTDKSGVARLHLKGGRYQAKIWSPDIHQLEEKDFELVIIPNRKSYEVKIVRQF